MKLNTVESSCLNSNYHKKFTQQLHFYYDLLEGNYSPTHAKKRLVQSTLVILKLKKRTNT